MLFDGRTRATAITIFAIELLLTSRDLSPLKMQDRNLDSGKGRRRDFLFGVIVVTLSLPLLVLIERSLGFNTRWLVGANCVIIILVFSIVMRHRRRK